MCLLWKEGKEKQWRNRTIESGKNLNAWGEGKLQVLGILKADSIKQAEIKEKIRKNASKEWENF